MDATKLSYRNFRFGEINLLGVFYRSSWSKSRGPEGLLGPLRGPKRPQDLRGPCAVVHLAHALTRPWIRFKSSPQRCLQLIDSRQKVSTQNLSQLIPRSTSSMWRVRSVLKQLWTSDTLDTSLAFASNSSNLLRYRPWMCAEIQAHRLRVLNRMWSERTLNWYRYSA